MLDTKNLILSPMQGAGVGDDFFMSPQPNRKMIADFVRLIQYFFAGESARGCKCPVQQQNTTSTRRVSSLKGKPSKKREYMKTLS